MFNRDHFKDTAGYQVFKWNDLRRTFVTWFPNPIPAPSKILPTMSMARFWARPLQIAPSKKNAEAACMVFFLPNLLHDFDAKKQQTVAERYSEDVKSCKY